jgi:biopolymer transport protein TolR
MLRKSRTSPRLFSDFDTLQFASVMGMVVFVVLLIFMTIPVDAHRKGGSVDLPRVLHPVAMRGADREDAMKVMITRDGSVYFDFEQIRFGDMPAKIQDRLKDREVERKVYIVADMRARWGGVKLALDGVRRAGIIRVAILADQGQLPKLSR